MWNGKSKGMFVGSLLVCGATAMAGPDWVEGDHGDAGSLPKVAQPINMTPTGKLRTITGALSGTGGALQGGSGDFEDMYHFRIIEPTLFCATTECLGGELCGSADFNTRLWLFDSTGHGLLGNDFFAQLSSNLGTPQGDSYIGNAPCDETTGMILLTPGDYYLAITGFNFPVGQTPMNGLQPIFDFNDSREPGCAFGEVSGPDGAGGPYPIADWQNNQDKRIAFGQGCFGCGNYVIAICTDSAGQLTSTLTAHVDIKPGACPNPFNRGSNGVEPISILGTATFNVHDINLSTVRVGRVDGMFDTAAPHEGPPGPHSVYEDTGTPLDGAQCACNSAAGDGIVDLSMKFKTQDMVTAMHLDELSTGALVPLKFTGQLSNGQAFEAFDCLRLVPPGTPPGMISVKQSMPNNFIEVSPPDLTLDAGGFGNFLRDYPVTTVVTLAAPVISQGKMFVGWKVDNNPTLQTTPNISLTVATQTHSYEAIYVNFMVDN
jgi:hypothetical protein